MFSVNKLQSFEEFSAATGVIIPANASYTAFYEKYVNSFSFDPSMVDVTAWNTDASPVYYYLVISYLLEEQLVYQVTNYDLTYIGCVESMTLFNYKQRLCVRLHNVNNSFCRSRQQLSFDENAFYYFYVRIWDGSTSPPTNYGNFNFTNFSMDYSSFY